MVTSSGKLKHYTIPVFIPGEACPFQCIFCDQRLISGKCRAPEEPEIRELIEKHLATFPPESSIEVGFFGGTFTGLSPEKQRTYLDIVLPYVSAGKITSIRISTRPDYIDEANLSLLAGYPVKTIELGVQSFDPEVLVRSGRGHTAEDSVRASEMILNRGFTLGLQMMVGLPGDSPEKVQNTAKEIVRLGASETRIYPVLVIHGTELETLFLSGEYQPLTLNEAVQWTKPAMEIFEASSVKVIRVGLHHSDFFMKKDFVAGPAHPSFRELVMTEIWHDRLSNLTRETERENIRILVNSVDLNFAVGYHGKNRKMLEGFYKKVKFAAMNDIPAKTFYADHYR